MELQKLINNYDIKDFNFIKYLLTNEPYNLIIKEDKDNESLYMVTYDKKKSNMKNDIVKECRGLILEKNTNKIICYTFNKSLDIDPCNLECPSELDWKNTIIEKSVDGTQIRLYYYNDKWNYSTTRCIDANKARWYNKRSFYEMFKDVDNLINYDKLDKNSCYSFVLKHPDNRIVVNYLKPSIVHVLTRNLTTYEEEYEDIGIERAEIYKEFKNYSDVINKSKENIDFSSIKLNDLIEEGYILHDKKNNIRIKIKNNSYKNIKEIRGNTNNLFYRYLELRSECRDKDCIDKDYIDKYITIYPEHKKNFIKYEESIKNLTNVIYKYYIDKFIKKKEFVMPKCLNKIIYEIHGKRLTTFKKIKYDDVFNEINKLHPSQLCYIHNKILASFHPYK